ncbi:hypothetical protein qu_44 [Acanthamoeba polyphaga mimivirus]|uniref:Uncharacterized protein n=1 Tax=Acanthamoeba polyphaga mimivirus TaxID=212035 RepID=A0A0G2Y6Q4_MIMIV|nr:hypothetical protein [Acanthamoeba polyphaga mimivirus]QTF48939.1 hypothetical protein [Mimivirus reunion]WMV61382.1 hypothetical protein qu_44 [Mimivirus sp.]WMV62359.1 hypothetical protein qu_44 [Acanthamoeba polyphaga mimivirus]WMV63336.1 hypothetical protein qu_44 [Mimivirus sp.]
MGNSNGKIKKSINHNNILTKNLKQCYPPEHHISTYEWDHNLDFLNSAPKKN